MKNAIKSIDGMSKIFKIILALPILDIFWSIYRTMKSASKGKTLGVVLGVLLIIIGLPFMWIIDLITIVVSNKVVWID